METTAQKSSNLLKDLSHSQLLDLVISLKSENFILKQIVYAKKSERLKKDPEGMDLLFDEIENTPQDNILEEVAEKDVSGHKRKYKRGKRSPLPKGLKRVRQEFDLAEEDKVCTIHNLPLTRIGEDVREKLDIIPASVKVLEQVTFKFKCDCCSKENEKVTIISSKKVPDPIPKSIASAGLLAYIAISKFEDALPLYRQEKIYKRCEIDINRSSMSRWMIQVADLCQPLVNLIHEDLLINPVLHGDETTVQVLNEKHKKPEHKSYMWVLASRSQNPAVLYRYFDNRSKNAGASLLDGFKGTLICDGYKVYDSLASSSTFKLAGCMAHCRRKFFFAEKEDKKNSKGKRPIASQALEYIKKLYAIEKEIRDKDHKTISKIRLEKSTVILEDFKKWLDIETMRVLPKSLLGKAISYALNQWEKLTEFCHNPLVAIDNNYIEAQIRIFTIGRKNWIFSCTENGAHSSATLYSLIASAKVNKIDPYEYLHLVFKELPKCESLEDFEKLLPYNIKKYFSI